VILLAGLTSDPTVGPYLRGQMHLNRIDLQLPLREWLDALYALWTSAPHEVLKEARKVLDRHSVRIAPDRDTWGLLPEHVAQMGGFGVVEE
jgi:hypothetical protein